MIAQLQRLLLFWFFSIVGGWIVICMNSGEEKLAIFGAIFLLTAHAQFLALEFLLLAIVHGNDKVPRAATRLLLSAWISEVLVAPIVFCWRQPFCASIYPDFLPLDAVGRRGVVLVHGLFCNRGLWNPWMRELRTRSIPFIAVNLEPVFGSLDNYLHCTEDAIQRIQHATGLAPVLVGHSMGGLAVRAWFNQVNAYERAWRIITIGAPHQGTWLARFSHTVNGQQMRLSSRWLTDLVAREKMNPPYECFTCFYSNCDNVVFPASNATLPGADNRHLPGIAHLHMAYSSQVFEEVCRWTEPHQTSSATF